MSAVANWIGEGNADNSGALTLPVTVSASADLLVVAVQQSGAAITLTADGVALSLEDPPGRITAGGFNTDTSFYTLASPSTGSIDVVLSGGEYHTHLFVCEVEDVDLATGYLQDNASVDAGGAGSISATVTSDSDGVVLGHFANWEGTLAPINDWNTPVYYEGTTQDAHVVVGDAPGAASVTLGIEDTTNDIFGNGIILAIRGNAGGGPSGWEAFYIAASANAVGTNLTGVSVA